MTRGKRARTAPTTGGIRVLHRGAAAAAIESLTAAWRESTGKLIAGPANIVAIDLSGGRLVGRRLAGRPTDVFISPELLLTRRLAIPAEARRELRSAIGLMIRSETPFAASEVLVTAEPAKAPASEGVLDVVVHLVPSVRINIALEHLGLAAAPVRSVAVDSGVPGATIRFPPSPLRWRPAAAVAGALLSLASAAWLVVALEQGADARRIEALDNLVSRELTELTKATDALAAARAERAGEAGMSAAIDESMSAFELLGDLRSALGEATEVTRIEMRDGRLRLFVKTPAALSEARTIGEAVSYAATVDGPIVIDPVSGIESAVILIQRENG